MSLGFCSASRHRINDFNEQGYHFTGMQCRLLVVLPWTIECIVSVLRSFFCLLGLNLLAWEYSILS